MDYSRETSTAKNVDRAQRLIRSVEFNGLCQTFVDLVTYGRAGKFPAPVHAWSGYTEQGIAHSGIEGMEPGDLVFFAADDSNRNLAHVGVYVGADQYVSVTDRCVEQCSLADWQERTGQQLLGYVRPVTDK
jgi:cell wall-associated NlpC family hydrolase